MGTRGLFGFRKNGEDKLIYRHYDSYPDGLGYDFLDFIRNNSIESLSKLYDLILQVDGSTAPETYQVNYCTINGYCDLSVSTKSFNDWYCLTRHLQDNFSKYQDCIDHNKFCYAIDNNWFIKDSWCEFAYIFDVDAGVLEFYVGFQKEPDPDGRYGQKPDKIGYYPAKLVHKFSWEDVNGYSKNELVKVMNSYGEDGKG